MGNMKRNMKRQQERNLLHKFQPKTVNPANKTKTEAKPLISQTSKDAVELVGQQSYYAGLTKGMQTAFLFSIDALEHTMEETKGVGQKLSQSIRTKFHVNLHEKSLFDTFMAEEPKGEVFIVNKEEQEFINLLRHVESIVYDKENNKLTIRDLLSILNFEQSTKEELTAIISKLKDEVGE